MENLLYPDSILSPHHTVSVLGPQVVPAHGDVVLLVWADLPPCAVSSPTGEAPGAKPVLAPSYIVLIVVAIFALVTGAAALLIVRYQRMTGKYNFKTQSDDFSYQVFHD